MNIYRWAGKAFLIPLLLAALIGLIDAEVVGASETTTKATHGAGETLLWIVVILLAAKITGIIEKWKQPSVLGELLIGMVLGNLTLIGIHFFDPIKTNEIIKFLAELGVVILLFQIGLESNIKKMGQVGVPAFLVAIIGVVIPFVLGTWVITPWLLPGLDFNTYLFAGAALVATSVSIPARIFRDLGMMSSRAAQVILGAAVIDDVLGLIVLATVSAIATLGAVSIGAITWIAAKAILFLIGAIVVGQLLAPHFGKWMSKIHTGVGMKLTLAISFGLIVAYFAEVIGLAPIVGAFAAGLVLDPVHFKQFDDPKICNDILDATNQSDEQTKQNVSSVLAEHSHQHIEHLIEPLGHFLVPIFFVVTGMSVDLSTLTDPKILLVALALTAAAFVGKLLAGLGAGRGDGWIVGWGMVPRGEVGLIFATVGRGLGVVPDNVFSVIVVMVILSTLITPLVLSVLLRRQQPQSV